MKENLIKLTPGNYYIIDIFRVLKFLDEYTISSKILANELKKNIKSNQKGLIQVKNFPDFWCQKMNGKCKFINLIKDDKVLNNTQLLDDYLAIVSKNKDSIKLEIAVNNELFESGIEIEVKKDSELYYEDGKIHLGSLIISPVLI